MQARIPARPRPASNFELYSWFFMRVSAIALFTLAVFHLVWMHIVVGLDAINFEVIAQRWQSPGWRLYDMFLLVFGWLHGANGMRVVIDDYIRSQGWRVLLKSVLYVLVFVIVVLGAYVIFTFES
ncbi:MAG: succinate dehydrogenase, hydrophobic membrane anchor protein [Anaerolineae bacterium]